jgi:hypothetical protein
VKRRNGSEGWIIAGGVVLLVGVLGALVVGPPLLWRLKQIGDG